LKSPALPVITCLDLISYRTPALSVSFEAYRLHRGLLFASLYGAQAVLAISEHGRREIVDEFRLPPGRVHCTPLGVDASFFGTRDAVKNGEVLRRHGIDPPYFLCSGSDYPHKNLSLLLRGYGWLRSLWTAAVIAPAIAAFATTIFQPWSISGEVATSMPANIPAQNRLKNST